MSSQCPQNVGTMSALYPSSVFSSGVFTFVCLITLVFLQICIHQTSLKRDQSIKDSWSGIFVTEMCGKITWNLKNLTTSKLIFSSNSSSSFCSTPPVYRPFEIWNSIPSYWGWYVCRKRSMFPCIFPAHSDTRERGYFWLGNNWKKRIQLLI